MMKKSILFSAFACLSAVTISVSAFTYATVRIEERSPAIDFQAFRNAAANIAYITQSNDVKTDSKLSNVTTDIVNTIEKEVRGKIRHTRLAMVPKKVVIKPTVIAKNWNDIKPEFNAVDLKVDATLLSAVTSTDSISEFEINNKELIKLYGFETEALSFETFSNVEIASLESVDTKEDAVTTAQAATATHVVEEITPAPVAEEVAQEVAQVEEKVDNADDMVVFDYSKNEAPKKTFDAPISNTVKEAIEREVRKSPVVAMNTQKRKVAETTTNQDELEKAMNDEDNLVFDYTQQSLAAVDKGEEASAFTAAPSDTTVQAEFTIKASEVNLSTQKVHPAVGYEFVPDYDRAERADDQASGEIKLGYSLSGDVNTQTGVVQAQGFIPTRIEANLLNKGMNVPLLSDEGIQKFLSKKETAVTGNLLMVAVDPSITDVEIDSEYSYKIFFSSKFKLLESKDNAAYILFLGVRTGNVSLRYLLSNKETAQKIVYVGDGEMYFEDADFINTERTQYTLNTRSLLGKKLKELSINGSDVTFFGSKNVAKKKALNVYEIKVPEMIEGTRKYLEFKHLGESLFVGTTTATEIEIPGKDFIGRVLAENDLREIGSRCMVQINLSKDLRDIKANGKNKNGEMFTETSFLDKDGNFSRDNLEMSEKVFLTGDMEGLFNVRLDYTDGSTDFLKTFCSEGSYLIEQL